MASPALPVRWLRRAHASHPRTTARGGRRPGAPGPVPGWPAGPTWLWYVGGRVLASAGRATRLWCRRLPQLVPEAAGPWGGGPPPLRCRTLPAGPGGWLRASRPRTLACATGGRSPRPRPAVPAAQGPEPLAYAASGTSQRPPYRSHASGRPPRPRRRVRRRGATTSGVLRYGHRSGAGAWHAPGASRGGTPRAAPAPRGGGAEAPLPRGGRAGHAMPGTPERVRYGSPHPHGRACRRHGHGGLARP